MTSLGTLFVTSADAGAGKTLIAAALVKRFRALGVRAVGVKPVATGCGYGEDHDLVPKEGPLLREAAAPPPLPMDILAPFRFSQSVAPLVAADAAGMVLALDAIVDATRVAHEYGELLIVEGPGGALSPVASDGATLDLAERLGATVVVVVRDALGGESQALLVIEAARRRALPIAGVLISRHVEEPRPAGLEQIGRMIRERGGVKVFTPIPWIAGDDLERIQRVSELFVDERVAEELVVALGRP